MDGPETSMRSGSDSARVRSSLANDTDDSGFVLDIAGLPVLMGASDEAHLDAVRSAFGTTATSPAEPRVELTYGPGRLPMPGREPDAHQPDLDVWNDGDILRFSSATHGIQGEVSPQRARLVATTTPHERSLRRVFQVVITHVLAHHHVFVVHAASMRRGDRGLLALGETGKGKSTLALAAFQHDWQVMGDDLVAVWLVDDVPMIRGLPKPMALPKVAAGAGSEHLADARTLEWDQRERRHVPVDRLDLRPVALGAIVVVEHGETEHSRFEPASADRMMSRLMSSYTSVGDAPLMRAFFPVAVRATRVPAGIVFHGTDESARLAGAQRLLEHIAVEW